MVELEPVHLGTRQVIVDLLRNRPLAHVELRQPTLVLAQLAELTRHRSRRVVRHAVIDYGLVELPEILEKTYEIAVRPGSLLRPWRRLAGYRRRPQR